MCDQVVPFDNFKVLASSNSELHLQIKEKILISCDQPVLKKMKHIYHHICLNSYRTFLQSRVAIYCFQ